MKSKLLYAAATAAILTGLLPAAVSAAGSASFSLTPTSGTYTQGSSFTVQVHENGDNVNVVTAKLTYDASKLTCNGVGDSSAFPSTVTATCGGGSVTISRYTTSTVSGDAVVGSINFTAIAGSGSTSVNFASGSQIASDGQNIWNGDTTGGTYNLTTPATTPGRGSDGSGSTGSSTNTGSVAGSSTQTTGNSAHTTSTDTPATTAQDSATTTATGTNGNDTAKKETAGADTTKNTADKHSSKAWIWLLIVLAAVAGASAYLVQHKRTEAIAAAAEAAKKAKASAPKKAAPKAKKSK